MTVDWNLVAAWLSAGATALYAALVWRTLREMQRQRTETISAMEAQRLQSATPVLILGSLAELNGSLGEGPSLTFSVRNIGGGPAVTVEVELDFPRLGMRNMRLPVSAIGAGESASFDIEITTVADWREIRDTLLEESSVILRYMDIFGRQGNSSAIYRSGGPRRTKGPPMFEYQCTELHPPS